MNTLYQANQQWMSRPDDERFLSLNHLLNKVQDEKARSFTTVSDPANFSILPKEEDPKALTIKLADDSNHELSMTNWAFGQVAALAKAPVGYLRSLPAPLVADCMNYGLRFNRERADVGLLAHRTSEFPAGGAKTFELRAATGPRYGRIWNADIVSALVRRFGDGVTGDWKVPGVRGTEVPVTHDTTTIFGSDRDMFVFLADEKNRIEMPNRRNGEPGSLARGFFVWNSEVGSQSIGAAFFLFDYACANRIVWGAEQFKEIRLRHTASAPGKWLDEITPVLIEYSNAAAAPVEATIRAAQEKKFDTDLDSFLSKRFSKGLSENIKQAHVREEGRPIETLWDVVTGATAYAKTIEHQDRRVEMEREAGRILSMAA